MKNYCLTSLATNLKDGKEAFVACTCDKCMKLKEALDIKTVCNCAYCKEQRKEKEESEKEKRYRE